MFGNWIITNVPFSSKYTSNNEKLLLLWPPFKSLVEYLTLALCSYRCDLYTVVHGSIAVNSCQIELPQKNVTLLSEISIVIYKAGKHTGVENDKFIHFNVSPGTYLVEDFNAKVKVAILQQIQDW